MPEFNLAQVVQGAATAASCPIGVFYLCGNRGFEVAVTFGCSIVDAIADGGLVFLDAAKRQQDGLTIWLDVHQEYGLRLKRPWIFGVTSVPARFVAAVHVAYEQTAACGLLLAADNAPHTGFSMTQRYMLRASSARITEMLEFQGERQFDGRRGQLWPTNDASDQLLASVAHLTSEAIMVTRAAPPHSLSQRIVSCNAAFSHLTGYSEAELVGLSPRILRSDRTDSAALRKLHSALLHRKMAAVELVRRRKDGSEFVADVRIVPGADREGDVVQWFESPRETEKRTDIEDYRQQIRSAEAEITMLENEKAALEAEIQERKRIESRLQYLASHDNLTSAYNRQFLIDQLAAAFDRLTTDSKFRFAVLLLDLNGFKLINDSFGHRVGDMMLIEIADRLRNCTRVDNVVGRLGGDEFAILVQGFDSSDYVVSVAGRVAEVVRQPVHLNGQDVFSSASIGAAYATEYYRVPEEILRDADIAMYEAKRRHKGFQVFDNSMHRDAVVTSQLRTELQRAVVRSEFYLEYQPIFDLVSGEITGVEALVRWQHPTRGKLLPGTFISVAEEMGLIPQIGDRVLREACEQMREWQDNYPDSGLRLSVNISGYQLTDVPFIQQLSQILADTGLAQGSLQLEVTESVLFPTSEPIVTVLTDAKALGVRFALDDFGTGYSSLGYLDRYPIDAIKIDRSFVAGLPERQRTLSIVKAIIEMARALNLEVVAEGIEKETQMHALLGIGCTQAQGFLLSKPISTEAVERMLRKRAKRNHKGVTFPSAKG